MSETDSQPEPEPGSSPEPGAEPAPRSGGVREVKSAGRTVDLLEALAERGDRPARLREHERRIVAVMRAVRTKIEPAAPNRRRG